MFRAYTWEVGRIPSVPCVPAGHVPSPLCGAPPLRAEDWDPAREGILVSGTDRRVGPSFAKHRLRRCAVRTRRSEVGTGKALFDDTGTCEVTLRVGLGMLCSGLVSHVTENVAVVPPMIYSAAVLKFDEARALSLRKQKIGP